ncbi:hypothetical protein [Nitratidesulfovibrio liaohensis]|uniref:Uncharacterized protein n=1 Tax=Nitratidesulfovibrio liaohensis TaxID=2604158 RepID=A0ABY9QWQ9_9BACT|nr:hypothetical protein [Nitratidesulfovibrio liaohensis]WMW63965.1 hypothetical protein KPS_001938 [Nitratidesulfovibrio liaohensis]
MYAINYLLNLCGMAMLAGAAFNWLRWRSGNQAAGIRARSLAIGGAMLLVFGNLVSPIETKVVQPVNATAPVTQSQQVEPQPAPQTVPQSPAAPAQPDQSAK